MQSHGGNLNVPAWSPVGDVIWGGYGNFEKWDLAGGGGSLEASTLGCGIPDHCLPHLLLSALSLVAMFYPSAGDQATMHQIF